ncbi:MAG TPA: 50S ribosomal protein L25 [Anaerolineae bacterium]|nr:50S ribosomal protein L25 [Anaerolineae bacterium]
MEQIELRAQSRTVFGKKTRALRRSGIVPATLYGPRTEALSLQMAAKELNAVLDQSGTNRLISLRIDDAGKPRMILARDVQRDVITQSLLHVDLYEVVMTEKITAEIPITLIGVAPAVINKEGLLVRGIDSLHVHCLPDQLSEAIEVDLSVLEVQDQAILVKDLIVGQDIEILTSPDEVVVKVLALREEVLEPLEELEAEPAEVEVITEAREIEGEPERVVKEAEPAEDEEEETETE